MSHEVTLQLKPIQVKNRDVEVSIKKKGKKIGSILISKGNVVWMPSGKQVRGYQLTWDELQNLMRDEGKEVRVGH